MRDGSEIRFWRKVQLCQHVTVRIGEHYWSCKECCWPWLGCRSELGYGRTRYVLMNGDETYVTRVAWAFAHHGLNPPADKEVAHTCDNPPCGNPSHFWLATHKENMEDCTAKGRRAHGWGRRPQKLSYAKAARIHTLAAQGLSQREIARVLEVSQPMVSMVLSGKAWPLP